MLSGTNESSQLMQASRARSPRRPAARSETEPRHRHGKQSRAPGYEAPHRDWLGDNSRGLLARCLRLSKAILPTLLHACEAVRRARLRGRRRSHRFADLNRVVGEIGLGPDAPVGHAQPASPRRAVACHPHDPPACRAGPPAQHRDRVQDHRPAKQRHRRLPAHARRRPVHKAEMRRSQGQLRRSSSSRWRSCGASAGLPAPRER